MSQGSLLRVPIELINEPKVGLRGAKVEDERFVGLMESIKLVGILEPILVKEAPDNGTMRYEIINGLQRYTAAKMCGTVKEIPVHVQNMADQAILSAQIMANIHRIETKPMEYTNQLKRILELNPMMTRAELATDLGKSVKWVDDRLSLGDLIPQIQELVAEGKVVVSNAYIIAKLDQEDQVHFVDKAITLGPGELRTLVDGYKKQVAAARKKGEDKTKVGFQPQPTLRKLSDLKEELENHKFSSILTKTKDQFNGFNQAIEWVLQMDPESVELQKADHEKRQADILEKREAAKKARLEEKQKMALEEAAKLKEQLKP